MQRWIRHTAKRYGKSWQAVASDRSKQNTMRTSRPAWGGRRFDGPADNRSGHWGYFARYAGSNKPVYQYTTSYRKRHWRSYGRKY